VGEWLPAASRFPGGLAEVTDAIKAAGMIPGLWLEPEVVGVRAAERLGLPPEAFFSRSGVRVAEWGRYQLDLRHPAAVAHLDAAVDRLVGEYGLGYLKLDYNIDIGTGSADGGHGLLGHNRAWLAWIERVLDRHPGLVIEACAAGGMRTDGATLARHSITSLTDQQDATLLPPIAAAAPAALPPEQGAMWAYPQGSDEAITLSMVTAMLGRIHLSGRLDLLDEPELALVADAIAVYRTYRGDLARGVPRWPLGLPRWDAGQTALAIDCGDVAYLALWRRDSPEPHIEVPWPEPVLVDPLFPAGAQARWDAGAVHAGLAGPHTACVLRLTPLRAAAEKGGPVWPEE
jgi:alpha-galactosidase